jgi:Trypsin
VLRGTPGKGGASNPACASQSLPEMSSSNARSPARTWWVAFSVSAWLACSGEAPGPRLSSTAPTVDIVAPPVGVPDRGDDPAVVAIDYGGAAPCSGALVAPDVVLTALHCVASSEQTTPCPSATASPLSLRSPASMRVLVGDDVATAAERARGRDVVVPTDAQLCGADLALLLLDRTIDDVQPLAVRSTGAATGQHVRTVRFASVAGASPGVRKLLRDHVAVMNTTATELQVAETLADPGGGPALDETSGEVLGVASRNDEAPARDVYTRADTFLSLVEGAIAESQGAATTGSGVKKAKSGPADMGTNCAEGRDCAAGVCLTVSTAAQQYCSRMCAAHDRCPARFRCQKSQQGQEVCVAS